jgi:pilus assembly protein CpaF
MGNVAMSAFGRRQGLGSAGGGRPAFGVARPMHGPGPITRPDSDSPAPGGGSQFPPLNALEGAIAAPGTAADAMQRLAERQAASVDPTPARGEGFEASIHRIKEQVLPRLLERVDPEAAATLGKDELAEEFRPIIGEVLAELKLTLNRREQFALEKVLVDELLGLGPLEELLAETVADAVAQGANP